MGIPPWKHGGIFSKKIKVHIEREHGAKSDLQNYICTI